MILNCQNICKNFGTEEILKDISFHIEAQEKAAIVGINGAGKSTLLKIIIGELEADRGQTVLARGATLGYLSQHENMDDDMTIYDVLLEAKRDVIELEAEIRRLETEMKSLDGPQLEQALAAYNRNTTEFERLEGYAYKSQIVGVLKGLGFSEEDFSRNIHTLSGGQKTRVSLGKLLLTTPDILLLDEPTNHLDMNSIAWLESFLGNYKGAVLIVSHDRYFLDRIVTKVIEISQHKAHVYQGNYTAYSQKKAALREAQLRQYLNQQNEIRHQEEVIRKLKSFNREKSIKRAESREKMLDKIEVLEKPAEDKSEMHFHLEPQVISGNDVLTVSGLTKAYPPLTLFQDVDFQIRRGETVAVIGNNGTGKTTLLKILNGLVAPDTGEFVLGSRVKIGYYDQEHQVLHHDKTLFDEISDEYPRLTGTRIRNTLAAFLFTGDDVFKQVGDLSGGERGRLSLAKLMLSECNFLILDEPTNHLDIVSKEILEQALNQYTGTVLYVSHDRYFINQTADRILDLTGNTFVSYIGNYDYYIEKKDEHTPLPAPEEAAAGSSPGDGKQDWQAMKEQQARERKRKSDLKKTEARILELEERDGEIDTLMELEEVYTDVAKCVELNREKTEIAEELEQLYETWETLAI